MDEKIIIDKEILEGLQNVTNALNHVSCEGMQNLLNLGGSIGILNEIIQNLIIRMEQNKDNE